MPSDLLESWKDVSRYLGHSVRTCQRLEQEAGLPIHRMDGSPKARIYAYTTEIDRWREKNAHHHRRARWRRWLLWMVPSVVVLITAGVLIDPVGLFRGPASTTSSPALSPAAAPVPNDPGAEGPFLAEARAAQEAYTNECDPEDLQRAIGLYRQAIASRPGSAAAHYGLGSCLQNEYLFGGGRESSYDGLRAAYAEAFRLGPDLPEALLGMGWSHLFAGQRDEAYAWIVRARDAAPSDPRVNYQVGCFLGHIGLVEKAVLYLTRTIDLGERSTRAYQMRAHYESLAGQYRAAADDMARLCQMNPTNAKMFCGRARVLVLLKDFDGAAQALEVAKVLAAGDADLSITRAFLDAARGDRDKALEALRSLGTPRPEAATALVPIHALLSRIDQAVEEIETLLVQDRSKFQRVALPYATLGDPANFVYDRLRDQPAFRQIVAGLKAERDDLLRRYQAL